MSVETKGGRAVITASRAALGALLALGVGSCSPPLPQVWTLSDFRVLGVKGSPAEADRGASFTLTLATADVRQRDVQVLWLLFSTAVSPDNLADAGSGASISGGIPPALVQACLSGTLNLGPLQCAGGTTATFTVPATGGAPDSSGRESLSVLGYACAGGTIGVQSEGGLGFTCDGMDAKGWQFTGTYHVHGPTAINPPNQNPSISEVRFGVEGMATAITADAPPTIQRCTSSMHEGCTKYHFEVGFADGSREMYMQPDPVTGQPATHTEQLTTGFVVDHGTLAGGFRTDSDTDPMSVMSDDYYAPADPGPVKVVLYSSDGRGGFDWTTRVLTVQ